MYCSLLPSPTHRFTLIHFPHIILTDNSCFYKLWVGIIKTAGTGLSDQCHSSRWSSKVPGVTGTLMFGINTTTISCTTGSAQFVLNKASIYWTSIWAEKFITWTVHRSFMWPFKGELHLQQTVLAIDSQRGRVTLCFTTFYSFGVV